VIRRHPRLETFEEEQRRRPADYDRNRRIYENLWREARHFGMFSQATLDGIGTDIDYARVINGRSAMRPSRLTEVLDILRRHLADIRPFGVRGMSVFGSVARDKARPESDVDTDYLSRWLSVFETDLGRPLQEPLQQLLRRAAGAGPRKDKGPKKV
jgi:predicted nucleotidyltransferase